MTRVFGWKKTNAQRSLFKAYRTCSPFRKLGICLEHSQKMTETPRWHDWFRFWWGNFTAFEFGSYTLTKVMSLGSSAVGDKHPEGAKGAIKKTYCWWKKSCTSWCRYPSIHRVLYIPGGAGFLATVPLHLKLQIYSHVEHLWATLNRETSWSWKLHVTNKWLPKERERRAERTVLQPLDCQMWWRRRRVEN